MVSGEAPSGPGSVFRVRNKFTEPISSLSPSPVILHVYNHETVEGLYRIVLLSFLPVLTPKDVRVTRLSDCSCFLTAAPQTPPLTLPPACCGCGQLLLYIKLQTNCPHVQRPQHPFPGVSFHRSFQLHAVCLRKATHLLRVRVALPRHLLHPRVQRPQYPPTRLITRI